MLFVCYLVATLDNWLESERELSANSGMLPLDIWDQVQ